MSPTNTAEDIERRVDDWLRHGTLAVLVVYSKRRRVVSWRDKTGVVLGLEDELDLDPIVSGFRCKVSALFPSGLADDEGPPEIG